MTQQQEKRIPTRSRSPKAEADGALPDDAFEQVSGGTSATVATNTMKSNSDTQNGPIANLKAS